MERLRYASTEDMVLLNVFEAKLMKNIEVAENKCFAQIADRFTINDTIILDKNQYPYDVENSENFVLWNLGRNVDVNEGIFKVT